VESGTEPVINRMWNLERRLESPEFGIWSEAWNQGNVESGTEPGINRMWSRVEQYRHPDYFTPKQNRGGGLNTKNTVNVFFRYFEKWRLAT